MRPKPQETIDLVTFSEKIFNGKLHFLRSHGRCSIGKGVLRNFAKFTGKHQCQSLFLNKVVGQAQVFYCKMCDISTNTFFTYTSGRLLQRNRKVLTYKENLTYSFQVIFLVSKLYELYENYTIYIYVGPDRNIGQYLYLRAFSMVIYGNLNSNFLLFFSFFLTVRKLLKSNP